MRDVRSYVKFADARGLAIEVAVDVVEPLLPVPPVGFELLALVVELEFQLKGVGAAHFLEHTAALLFEDAGEFGGLGVATFGELLLRVRARVLTARMEMRKEVADVGLYAGEKLRLHLLRQRRSHAGPQRFFEQLAGPRICGTRIGFERFLARVRGGPARAHGENFLVQAHSARSVESQAT